MKVLSVVGARPQFVKVAPLDVRLRKQGIAHVIVHTGQHYDYELSRAFFDQLSIPEPDYNLEVGSGTHAYQTGRMLERLGEVISQEKPDLVLVYGDTNSTAAGALAAVKLRIPAGHVEAGLRSFDFTMPEEINRIVADKIAQLHFAPTETAIENLQKEGVSSSSIYHVGNIMAETLLVNLKKAESSTVLDRLKLVPDSYAVLTCHRQENTDVPARLKRIFRSLASSPVTIVFPAHPRTKRRLADYGLLEEIEKRKNFRFIEPLPYLDFIWLEKNALFLITDSGGVQEEALMLKKPCITLRYNTERVETVAAGCNRLVGAEEELIREALQWAASFDASAITPPPKWDSEVSARIVSVIEKTDLSQLLKVPEVFMQVS